jgi:thioesterase domain-containing protein
MRLVAIQSDDVRLVPLRTSEAKSPLFCIAGIAGTAESFTEMVSVMDADQPVYALDLRELPDPHVDFTIEQLAPSYMRVIQEHQPYGPYNLCGHSFGGLVAYEVATSLLSKGENVNLLALLDVDSPTFSRNLSMAESIQFEKAYIYDRLKKYARNLMHGNLEAFFADALAFLAPRVGPVSSLLRPIFKMFNRPYPIIFRINDRAFSKAWWSYTPRPYTKRLVLFRAEKRGPEFDEYPTMGWDGYAFGGIDVHIVPGGHVNMMSLPNVRTLVAKMTPYLGRTP